MPKMWQTTSSHRKMAQKRQAVADGLEETPIPCQMLQRDEKAGLNQRDIRVQVWIDREMTAITKRKSAPHVVVLKPWPPPFDVRIGIPGSKSRVRVRHALRCPPLAAALFREMQGKRCSPAAQQFLHWYEEDQKRAPVPCKPVMEGGLSVADFLKPANAKSLCHIMLARDEDLSEGARRLRDHVKQYQDQWE